MMNGEIIGSLNHGDPSAHRFNPGMDTTLLERLAVKVSICLSNVSAQAKMRLAADRDLPTGLLNRKALVSVLERECGRTRRYKTPLCVILLGPEDLDGISERRGIDVAEAVTNYIAETLGTLTRDSDVVARFSWDQFALLVPSVPLSQAAKMAERLRLHFQNHPMKYDGSTIAVSIIFGVAGIPTNGNPGQTDALLAEAVGRLNEFKEMQKRRGQVIRLGGASSSGDFEKD
jgi:diguanylate cyclase (GGDEF)-like protein